MVRGAAPQATTASGSRALSPTWSGGARAAARARPFTTRIVAGALPSLDRTLGPLGPGDVVLVTASGQAERLSFLTHCATHQPDSSAVAVLCLEHTVNRVVQVALASQGRIPLVRLDAGGLERSTHWPALADAVEHHHQKPVLLLEPETCDHDTLLEALQHLRSAYPQLAVVVVDSLERVDAQPRVACGLLWGMAQELGLVVVAGVSPETPLGEIDSQGCLVGSELVARGVVRAIVQLSAPLAPRSARPGWAPVRAQVFGGHHGAISLVPLELDPQCLAWRDPPVHAQPAPPSAPVSRREGKDLDAVYAAACCALLHEVGLAHYWDGMPHGPSRAWDLPQDERISDEQRLVVRVALDIWDNQGGVLLRDLRKLPAGLVVDVGELIADTGSSRGPIAWVERHLGGDWPHWMAEGRWHELLGAGWRGLLGRPVEELV